MNSPLCGSMSKNMTKKGLASRPSRAVAGKSTKEMNGKILTTNAVAAAYGKKLNLGKPKFSMPPGASDGRIRVRHREYVGDVAGSVAFATSSYSLNPGLVSVFNWLSSIANNFESYSFRSLKVCFATLKGTSTAGDVMLVVDYDPADSAPVSKAAFYANHEAKRGAVWESVDFNCDVQDLNKVAGRFVRGGSLASNLDIKTYDLGNLLIGTFGCADTSSIGELFVEYDIELRTPQSGASQIVASASASVTGGGTVSKTAVFGTAASISGGLPVTASSNTLTFGRVGTYLVAGNVAGTVFTGTAPTLTGTAASASITGSGYLPAAGAATSAFMCLVTVTAISQTLIVDWSAVCTTLTASLTYLAGYGN